MRMVVRDINNDLNSGGEGPKSNATPQIIHRRPIHQGGRPLLKQTDQRTTEDNHEEELERVKCDACKNSHIV